MAARSTSFSLHSDPSHDVIYDEFARTGNVDPAAHPAVTEDIALQPAPFSAAEHSGNYSDRYVLLDGSARKLTIHHWLLVHPSLVVPVDTITYILPAVQATTRLGVKPWGMGVSGVGWARDLHRLLPVGRSWENSFVVKWESGLIRAGFTVERKAEFVEALEAVLPGVTTRRVDEEPKQNAERSGYVPLQGEEAGEETSAPTGKLKYA